MEFLITDSNTKAEINIIEPTEGFNITKAFFGYHGILPLLTARKVDAVYPVSHVEFIELNDIAAVENSTMQRIHDSENCDDFDTLLSSYTLIVADYDTKVLAGNQDQEGSDLLIKTVGVNKVAQAKYHLINSLIDGEVIVKSPVNKKFWPLVNTSHTFKLIKAEDASDIGCGSQCWQVEASIDFVLDMPHHKNNRDFSSNISVIVACDEGSLFSYNAHYDHTISLSSSQAATAENILLNAVYSEMVLMAANNSMLC